MFSTFLKDNMYGNAYVMNEMFFVIQCLSGKIFFFIPSKITSFSNVSLREE